MSNTVTSHPAEGSLPGAPQKNRVAAGTYQVDADHTQVTWQLNHMGFSILTGQFGASGGTIEIDPNNPQGGKVNVTFKADQLVTTSANFTKHLKSADFFDVATHPTARFVSTSVHASEDSATVTGDLTIKGITKAVRLEATFVGAGTNPTSGKLNLGFHATTTIQRSEFGLPMGVPVVSDKVDLTIDAAFTAS